MKAIFLLALRNLTYRPGRSISCALGIALGMAIVMSVLIVDYNTILTESSRKPADYGEPDIEIKPHRPNPKLVKVQHQKLSEYEAIEDLTALFFDTVRIRAMNGQEESLKMCCMDTRASASFSAYRVETGKDLDFSGPPHLLLSRWGAERLGVKTGDIVQVWMDHPIQTVCRDGKIVPVKDPKARKEPLRMDFTVRGILAEEHLGLDRIAIGRFDDGIALSDGGYLLPIFWAKLAQGYDLPEVKAALKEHFAVDKPNRRAMVGRSPEENAFRNGVRACALLSLLLGLYIIFNSMSMSLVERIRQIGLMRAMGLTRGGLTMLFLVEGFLLTMAGCVISLFFTAVITGFMAAMNITTLGTYHKVDILALPWLQLFGIMLLGTIFSLLGVIYPVGKASNLSVIQAIRKGTIEFERQPFKGVGRILFFILILIIPTAYFIVTPMLTGRFLDMFRLVIYTSAIVTILMGLLLFFPFLLNRAAALVIAPLTRYYPVAGRLAESSMSTSRLRVFSTVSGLALVFAAIFVIAGVTDTLESETRTWAQKNLVRNIYLRSRTEEGLHEEELKDIEGIRSVMNLSASINAPFPVRAVDTDAIKRYGSMAKHPELCDAMKREDLILISSYLAKIYDFEEGDQLSLSTPLAGRKVFRICAISDEYGFYPHDRSFSAISTEKMISYFCVAPSPGMKWCLHLEDGADAETVRTALAERLGRRARITTGTDLKREWIWDLRGSFAIFYIIITLVALLSGVSILNSLVISIVERRRETALLRVVGLTPKQLRGILLMEAYSLGTLGGFFGLVLGVPIAILTVSAIKTISNLDLVVSFSVLTVLMTFFGALIVSIGASIYPMIRQSSTGLMEAVKIE